MELLNKRETMSKVTREELIAENAKLINEIETRDANDRKLRTTLSELLDSVEVEVERDPYSMHRRAVKTRTVILQDWIGIAFLIGELKADANYSILLEGERSIKEENQQLKETIDNIRRNGGEDIIDGKAMPPFIRKG